MLSKTAFTIIYSIGLIWFFAAGIYTYKVVIKDFLELKRNK
ncbi:MAG: hypothetical protein WCR27_05055 [Eubacteriales bacterium]